MNEENSDNKRHHYALTLFLFIMKIISWPQDNAILLCLKSLREQFVFPTLSHLLRRLQEIFF